MTLSQVEEQLTISHLSNSVMRISAGSRRRGVCENDAPRSPVRIDRLTVSSMEASRVDGQHDVGVVLRAREYVLCQMVSKEGKVGGGRAHHHVVDLVVREVRLRVVLGRAGLLV